jgi:hypothetical protein
VKPHTYYCVKQQFSLWIEERGKQWALYFVTRAGGNRLIGIGNTPEECARLLWSGNPHRVRVFAAGV